MKALRFFVIAACLCLSYPSLAQTSSVITAGLLTPNKVIRTVDHSLLVAEAGNRTPNTGRISVVNTTAGVRRTLVSGLPSAVSYLGGPAGDTDGPSGLALDGDTLFVTIGVGDAIVPGPGPGLEMINPAAPASPLFDSILQFKLPGGYTDLQSGFVMTAAQQTALAEGAELIMSNQQGRKMRVKVVANLPDQRSAPLPGNPSNVKASHLYGIDSFQKTLYVADSGHNDIKYVDIKTGSSGVFLSFPNRSNPLFPGLGGPIIEAVPDNVRRVGNTLLVPLLSGFPFLAGYGEIRSVDIKRGTNKGLIPNLTTAIDVLPAKTDTVAQEESEQADNVEIKASEGSKAVENDAFYTLEFSTNLLMGAPGRLRYYSIPTAAPVDLVTNLITPTSMAVEEGSGNIYITNIGPGTLTRVSPR